MQNSSNIPLFLKYAFSAKQIIGDISCFYYIDKKKKYIHIYYVWKCIVFGFYNIYNVLGESFSICLNYYKIQYSFIEEKRYSI